ncbi:MAG: HAD family hydrolase, partial [Fimbriimonadaceae bacterium]|nr:HAD family hydrolase [Fimbriimonadaceae bacterium]
MKYPESIKLLAIDLDGTLLCKELTFHSQIPLAFSAAKANDLSLVIATGRSIQSASDIVKPLNHEGHYVCANGCHVFDRDGSTLYQNHLNSDVKRTLIQFAQSRNLHITAYTPEGPCTLSNSRFLDKYKKQIQGLPVPIVSPEEIMNSEAHKIVFIAEPPRITLLRNELNSLLPKDQADMTESAPEYLEILPSGTNKSTGLIKLCQHLGLSENAVAAI